MSDVRHNELTDDDVGKLLEQLPDCDAAADPVAVCIQCGRLKEAAFAACLGCGFEPVEKQDQIRSLLLSDRVLTSGELEDTSARLKRGETVPFDAFLLQEYANILPYLHPRRFLGVRLTIWIQFFLLAAIFASPLLVVHWTFHSGLPGAWEFLTTDNWIQSPDRIHVACRLQLLHKRQENQTFETSRELVKDADGKFRVLLGEAATLRAEIEIEPKLNRKHRHFLATVWLIPGQGAAGKAPSPGSNRQTEMSLVLKDGEHKVQIENGPGRGTTQLELIVTEKQLRRK